MLNNIPKLIIMKNTLLLLFVFTLLSSCNTAIKKEKKKQLIAFTPLETNQNSSPLQKKEGYILMKNNCYACHNPNAASHDDIIAPPFMAVKMHYMRTYKTKDAFVKAIVNWVQNPSEEKSLMRGAVNRFKIMPKLPLPSADLEKIATYIYENKVDAPKWMGNHMKKMHKGRKGMMHKNN